MAECPVCGIEMNLTSDVVQHELIDCSDCGSELEVTGLHPHVLREAPREAEDWGQ